MKTKRTGLGRGLGAILESPETDITSRDISGDFVVGAIANIRITRIDANPFQPRSDFEQKSLDELAASIREQGVIQPITVRKMGYDRYQLISGERRLKASQIAGLESIPAYIRVADDEQMLELALIENIHREDLNPLEIAVSYQRLMEECDLTQENLSQKVGKDRATIANYVRLLKLPAEAQLALRNRLISMGHAKAILSMNDLHSQLRVLVRTIEKGLSVREVEKLAQQAALPSPEQPSGHATGLSFRQESARNEIRELLNTRVAITKSNNGKGSIVIKFSSEADLERLLALLRRS